MGDTTHVAIQIPQECLETAIQCLPSFNYKAKMNDFIILEFSEVNYGELEEFEELIALGIPCDYEWGKGSEYGSGRKYIRFTPEGEIQLIEYYDKDRNPDLNMLLYLLGTPEKLAAFIRQYHAAITPLPWDNQVEYGKIYRTRQLLLANT